MGHSLEKPGRRRHDLGTVGTNSWGRGSIQANSEKKHGWVSGGADKNLGRGKGEWV